jgi:putative protease
MPYDLENERGDKLLTARYLLSMRDMNRTDQLEALLDAGARSLKIEGRLKDAAYVKNVTAWYRQHLDAIFRRRKEYCASSRGRVEINFTPNPARSFNRGFTNYFMHGRTADLCNTITPKSMGERVGFVKEIRRDHIVVAGTASFANGDGLCYVAGNKGQESLVGFRVNKAVGNHLYPHRMPQGLTDGTIVYRNQDQGMEHTLSGKTSRRVLPLEWTLEETPQGFRLTAKQKSTCVSKAYECEKQLARTDQKASITDVLSKLGDTIYEVANVEIDFSQPWFIPRSHLTQWRREVLALLEQKNRVPTLTVKAPKEFSDLSKVKELNIDKSPLMTCRYCIRYQVGECLKRNPQAVRGPLYLRGADGRRFLLRFDCKNCQMMVELDNKE